MPDIIADNLKPIIILAIVVFALVRKIMEGINANKPAPPPSMEDIFGPDDEPGEADRRMRPVVPPPLRQPALPPPLQRATGEVFPGDTNAELARQRAIEERIRKIREAKLNAQAASAPVRQAPVAQRQPAVSHSLNLRLHNSRELRRAFVLKEILDRPVGLR